MACPSPVIRVSASGRVTRVAPSFAYISSSTYGGIFVPPCAVLPPECADPAVTNYLQSGDIVHFIANKQPVAKNGCEYVATKVTVSPNHGAMSEDALLSSLNENSDALLVGDGEKVLENVEGVICQVNETYAFVYCQAIHSTVFFPGSAYKSDFQDEPARLNAHFHAGNMVSLNVRKQTPKNGCEYLALRVNKIEKTEEGKEEGQIDTDIAVHLGVVVVVCEDYGYLFCEDLKGNVYFQAGACSAEHMCMLQAGDKVQCLVVPQTNTNSCSWKAIRVTPVSAVSKRVTDAVTQTEPVTILTVSNAVMHTKSGGDCKEKERVGSVVERAEQGSQTFVRAEDLLLHSIKSNPDIYEYINHRLPNLMKYCYHNTLQTTVNHQQHEKTD